MPSHPASPRPLPLAPRREGLYDPAFESDSCGVGFVAHIDGRQSHGIVQSGLQLLRNLQHRGACGCDQDTGDGAGILLQLPDAFFRAEADALEIELPPPGSYGVAFVFLPRKGLQRTVCKRALEALVAEEGQTVLGWRTVPVVSSAIGWLARSQEPFMEQLLIGRGSATHDASAIDRALYVIRRRAERWAVEESTQADSIWFAIPSCSARTIVYKGMLKPDQLAEYFPDLSDPDITSALALVHSRYSTNTFPQWGLAQPFHLLAHNGEINTLSGNVRWLEAREPRMKSPRLGDDLDKVLPLPHVGLSDSAILDSVLELLVQSGRSLPHAIMMLVPEAYEGQPVIDPALKAFYQYHRCLTEPWDGPASLVFSDGTLIGATLDRNGLRPSRYVVTHDGLVVMASEAGVLPIPPERVRSKGRLQPGKLFLVDTGSGRIIGDDEFKQAISRRQPYSLWIEQHYLELDDLPAVAAVTIPEIDPATLRPQQCAFGYTAEDLTRILLPMAQDGKEPVSSMGTDIPLAVLSRRSQLLPNYFAQRFAQVTNPPIDPIREKIVMNTDSLLGSEVNLLGETAEHARLLRLRSPTLGDADLARIRTLDQPGFAVKTVSTLFRRAEGEPGIEAASSSWRSERRAERACAPRSWAFSPVCSPKSSNRRPRSIAAGSIRRG
jgi:glutamate synthase (NADPH/NADH) large chain